MSADATIDQDEHVKVPVDVAAAPARSIRLRSGAATSAGNRRPLNEDAFVTRERFCIVADGMGGHAAGEVASAVAVDAIMEQLTAASAHHPPSVASLRNAISDANRLIRQRAESDRTEGMGTTVVVAVVVADPGLARPVVAIGHVGDSRCYRLRDGVLDLVTDDHSLVNELVAIGRIDRAAADRHPMSNVVTRALGADPTVDADIVVIEPGACRLLLCSDGLSDELSARTIGRVLAGVDDPQAAADKLVELTLAGRARDNVTVVVADVIDADVIDADDAAGTIAPEHRS
jgi:serine/threonine protein phosphatase PrpC